MQRIRGAYDTCTGNWIAQLELRALHVSSLVVASMYSVRQTPNLHNWLYICTLTKTNTHFRHESCTARFDNGMISWNCLPFLTRTTNLACISWVELTCHATQGGSGLVIRRRRGILGLLVSRPAAHMRTAATAHRENPGACAAVLSHGLWRGRRCRCVIVYQKFKSPPAMRRQVHGFVHPFFSSSILYIHLSTDSSCAVQSVEYFPS